MAILENKIEEYTNSFERLKMLATSFSSHNFVKQISSTRPLLECMFSMAALGFPNRGEATVAPSDQ